MRSLFFLVIVACHSPLSAQDEDTGHLNELIGEYTYSITLEQPGVESKCLGEAKVVWISNQAIRSEFSDHDIDFVIEYNPYDNNYLLTYVLHPSKDICPAISDHPLFLIHEAEMEYIQGVGYSYTEHDQERNWNLDIKILVEETRFQCLIHTFAGDQECRHYLNFCRVKI
jgi:hypothetical protein